jgi:hypothetical protein
MPRARQAAKTFLSSTIRDPACYARHTLFPKRTAMKHEIVPPAQAMNSSKGRRVSQDDPRRILFLRRV